MDEEKQSPPRDDLLRVATQPDWELRETSDQGTPPTLVGHFARFNEWTEIDSMFEGHFMERIAPKAFSKTFSENRDNIKVLFQHGHDPQIGDKVLGVPTSLEEDRKGAKYEVPLFDTSYNRDLIPGLKAGAYGASFRFKVIREDFVEEPDPSESNPKGLPERTITEAKVYEFGPVTFPAYSGATAGMRSITMDELKPAVRTTEETVPAPVVELSGKEVFLAATTANTAASTTGNVTITIPNSIRTTTSDANSTIVAEEAAPSHPPEDPERRDTQPEENGKPEGGNSVASIAEMQARRDEVRMKLNAIAEQNVGMLFDPDTQVRWDALKEDEADLTRRIAAQSERESYLRAISGEETHQDTVVEDAAARSTSSDGTGTFVTKRDGRRKLPENLFSLASYHNNVSSQEQLLTLYGDGARAAIEMFDYPHPDADKDVVNGHIEQLVGRYDSADKEIAQRVLVTGSPTYRSAFWKSMMKRPLSYDEQQALAAGELLQARALTTGDTGGVTVPIQIDPTVIMTSNGVINPYRAICRIETTTSYIWQGVTSAGMTAQYRAEGATMSDNSPALVAKPIQPERADAFVPFSWEAGQDWGSLEANLAVAIQDSKDLLESLKFSVGAGHASNEPQGVLVGAGTIVGTSGGTAIAVADIYGLVDALPPRYQAQAQILATQQTFSRIRQLATQAGPNVWADSLVPGNPPTLLGYPARKASNVGTAGAALTSSARWAIVGDWSRYVIVDRIGLSVRVIPDLFGGTAAVHYPTGQSGLVAYWRNSAGVIDSNAFRVGTIT